MAINITITENCSIQSDTHNWILNFRGYPSYFPKLEDLIVELFDKELRCSEVESFKELLNFKNSLLTDLQIALKPLRISVSGANSQVKPKKMKGLKK